MLAEYLMIPSTPLAKPLQGALILADPSLRDPNFSRSVLLLTDYNKNKGAHGYILNRPMDKTVGDVLAADEFSKLREVPIYIGGPVGQEHLTFAAFGWPEDTNSLSYTTHLSTTEAIQRHQAGEVVRAFLGYAGWSGGQLEDEIRQEAWITLNAVAEALSPGRKEDLWTALLSSLGPWGELLANTPEDPTLN